MGYRLPDSVGRKEQLTAELNRVVPLLISAGAERIILFGSMARDEVGSVSDIDLLVELPTTKRYLDRLDELYRLLQPQKSIDLLVFTKQEIEEAKKNNRFIRDILVHGEILYENAGKNRGRAVASPGEAGSR